MKARRHRRRPQSRTGKITAREARLRAERLIKRNRKLFRRLA